MYDRDLCHERVNFLNHFNFFLAVSRTLKFGPRRLAFQIFSLTDLLSSCLAQVLSQISDSIISNYIAYITKNQGISINVTRPVHIYIGVQGLFYSGHGCVFLGHIFSKKGICMLTSPKQMLFATISNENIFSKTQGTKLGAIIAPSKVLISPGVGVSLLDFK